MANITPLRRIAAVVALVIALASCGAPGESAGQATGSALANSPTAPASTPAGAPASPSASPLASPVGSGGIDDPTGFASATCTDTTYARCIEGLLTIMSLAPGSLVAICEYDLGTGDVVLIEDADEAEAACSADGLISPSQVVSVVMLPATFA
jgi:hypothetical protein